MGDMDMVDHPHHLLLLTTRPGGDVRHLLIGERGQEKEEAEQQMDQSKDQSEGSNHLALVRLMGQVWLRGIKTLRKGC